MKSLNHTFIRISLVFMAGIILGLKVQFPFRWQLVILFLSFLGLIFTHLRARKIIFGDSFFGIFAYSTLLLLGTNTAAIHQAENQPDHYINHLEKAKSGSVVRVRILERLKPNTYNERYLGEVEELIQSNKASEKLSGKILLNISRDDQRILIPQDELLTGFDPEKINQALNPYSFNYQEYMRNQGILRQLNLNREEFKYLGHEHNLPGTLALFRRHIISNLEKQDFTQEQMGIIQALLLGQRQEISREAYAEYAAAGAIHILAVSGLHVGILFILLSWLFRPLTYFKQGRLFQSLFILLFLWSFAGLANFSAPVLRAVTMFSFLAIGMQMNRQVSLMNSLFVSLFILLLINPYYILQAGFQLSYLAVFAIISLQPAIKKLYRPRFKADKLAWDILSVSLAAQLGIFPLSLYYFHQFPGLFFLTNLVILPFLGILLGYGILVILLAAFGALPATIASLLGLCINLLNDFVSFISHQKVFVIEEIRFDTFQLLAAYLLLIAFIFLIYYPKIKTLLFFLLAIIGIQVSSLYSKIQENSAEMIVFHKSGNSILGIWQGKELQLHSKTLENIDQLDFVKAYKREENINESEPKKLQNIYITNNIRLMVVDSSATYKITEFDPQIVLLTNSPKLNLDRLLEELSPELIIADGSNYSSMVYRWKLSCKKQKVPFHFTGEKGSFRISTGL